MWSGVRRTPDYELLLDNSRSFTQRGGEWNSYDDEVSQQWQGRFDELRVIGDKEGGYFPPCDWRRTRSYCTGCKVHVRNPALSAIVEDYFALLTLGDLYSQWGREEEAIVAYEQVLKRDPEEVRTDWRSSGDSPGS